jgi:hypothetical protein
MKAAVALALVAAVNAQTYTFDGKNPTNGWKSAQTFDGKKATNVLKSIVKGGCGWTWNKGGTTSGGTGPTRASGGQYYLFSEMTGCRTNSVQTLTTPPFTKKSYLTFDYSMYSSSPLSMGDLIVQAKVAGRKTPVQLFKQQGRSVNAATGLALPANVWTTKSVPLPKGTTQVLFQAKRKGSYQSDIAIDSVKLTTSKPASTATTVGTSFEMTHLDGWTEDGAGQWSRGARTGSGSTGPSKAKSGKYFMFLEVSGSSPAGTASGLQSPPIRATGSGNKLEFWYHMYGKDMGTLEAHCVTGDTSSAAHGGSDSSRKLWFKTGQQTKTQKSPWTKAVVNLPRNCKRIKFVGKRGKTYLGDMAIDAVKITNYEAVPSPVKGGATYCGFEGDADSRSYYCGWTRRGYWYPSAGRTSVSTGAYRPYKGHYYLYLNARYGKNGYKSYVESPVLPARQKSMTFRYHMEGSNIGSLAVEACTQFDSKKKRCTKWVGTTLKLVGEQHKSTYGSTSRSCDSLSVVGAVSCNNHWYKAAVNLPYGVSKVRFVGAKGNGINGNIGIDEIKLSNRAVITASCFFDTDTNYCGWAPARRTKDTSNFKRWGPYWRRNSRYGQCVFKNPKKPTAAELSRCHGTTGSPNTGAGVAQTPNYFVYMETSTSNTVDTSSSLTSPLVPPGAVSATFYYHMFGAKMGTL